MYKNINTTWDHYVKQNKLNSEKICTQKSHTLSCIHGIQQTSSLKFLLKNMSIEAVRKKFANIILGNVVLAAALIFNQRELYTNLGKCWKWSQVFWFPKWHERRCFWEENIKWYEDAENFFSPKFWLIFFVEILLLQCKKQWCNLGRWWYMLHVSARFLAHICTQRNI